MARGRKSSIQGVLFDWDGTLLNSYQADSAAYLAMFEELGIAWGLEDLALHYSPNWYDVYRKAKLPRTHWDRADRLWRRHYIKHKPRLIAGTRRILAQLSRRHTLGLVTSGDRQRVMRQLRGFRLKQIFATHVCSDDTRWKKPHPAPLFRALREIRLEPEQCVYVGDSPEDLEMARRAGMRAIAIIGQFPTEKRLRAAQPKILLTSLADLPQVISNLST
jgi:HAD superfamily hydrolase (TIGR01509 family)